MTSWTLMQCFYVAIGGALSPLLLGMLFMRERAWGTLTEPTPTFVAVVGTVALWPALLLLLLESDK